YTPSERIIPRCGPPRPASYRRPPRPSPRHLKQKALRGACRPQRNLCPPEPVCVEPVTLRHATDPDPAPSPPVPVVATTTFPAGLQRRPSPFRCAARLRGAPPAYEAPSPCPSPAGDP